MKVPLCIFFLILSTDMMEITQKLNLFTSGTTSIRLLMSNTDLDVLRQHLVRFIAENSSCPSSVNILALLGLYQLIAWWFMLEYNFYNKQARIIIPLLVKNNKLKQVCTGYIIIIPNKSCHLK